MIRILALSVIAIAISFQLGVLEASESDSGWYDEFAGMVEAERENIKEPALLFKKKIRDVSGSHSFKIPLNGDKEAMLEVDLNRDCVIKLIDVRIEYASGKKKTLIWTDDKNDTRSFRKNVSRFEKIADKRGKDDTPRVFPFENNLKVVFKLDGTETAITGTLEFAGYPQKAVATVQAGLEDRVKWIKNYEQAAKEIQNAIFNKYPDDDSLEEMRYVLPHTEQYLREKSPEGVFERTIHEKIDDLSEGGEIVRKHAEWDRAGEEQEFLNDGALELSIRNLMSKFPDSYPNGEQFLTEFKSLKSKQGDTNKINEQRAQLRRKALVDENPLLKGKQLLAMRRRDDGVAWKASLGSDYPSNWQGLSSLRGRYNKKSQIVSIPVDPLSKEKEEILYSHNNWVGRLDLHFDAEKVLFSSLQAKGEKAGNWHVYELDLNDKSVVSVTKTMPNDTDSYDACYTADDRILFVNSSGYHGVPCVRGSDYVGNLHLMDRETQNVRRLCYDQDNNWHPTMLPNGRVMFLRWEYTDSAHYFSRVLMHMNPDGTDQKEFYGSNSYWPNSLFYAKPVPGSSSKFFGIVTGHHGAKRAGELFLFDVAKGRKEATGVVQELPGYQKPIETPIVDKLSNRPGVDVRFIHPWPLSEEYVLVGRENGGIYLMDIFDNIVPIKLSEAYSYSEPIVLEKTTRPPVLPDRIDPGATEATAFISDIYQGRAMQGVPRGSVESLRVFRYEYSPRNMGGHYAMGMEAGWDVKILLGTVPVEEDGSAMFNIPANSPISLQPLDKDGQALQLMRSWMTAMPDEIVSCIGCHENQNDAPPSRPATAARKKPVDITPWKGQARAFGFMQEVQPVLDKYCVGCHDGNEGRPDFADVNYVNTHGAGGGTKSYSQLHPFVRRNGPEGDYTGLTPLEFHADTSPLIQMLKKGHNGVELSADAMERLVTWIDLNAPFNNSWDNEGRMNRRYELREKYAGYKGDYETPLKNFRYERTETFVEPAAVESSRPVAVKGFPLKENDPRFDGGERETLKLADGVTMDIVKIPAGQFAMGSVTDTPAEQPMAKVTIKNSFWMGTTEVSLKQYHAFDAEHKNGIYDMHFKDQVKPGYDMDASEDYPVIRVSWEKAMAFCAWLSKKTGRKVTLPTEAQWEWAARAGTDTPLFFGDVNADFSKVANLADKTIAELAVRGVNPRPIKKPNEYWDYVPKVENVNDGVLHLAPVDKYEANAFGLKNMIGNVSEWTRSVYLDYPYNDAAGRNSTNMTGSMRTVRGGSWRDRPKQATSSWRWRYPQWQRVYNVGFRVIVE
jgi:formylglycine-generating enzyme required for sulfatase activity